ncbi:hypothetical protein B0J13DRAFT_563334 [Dactylonectria estremocensis]|uniref:Bul1 C-terminal domain-containing protein n=1 Tax=Dactylonectria estremocensis TaxID=1079267 RepID=A0A9P9E2X7_9HYPO|nr:hypothetical protein B0J13DRAFT_563334 [Dactylonectria estremocensis]
MTSLQRPIPLSYKCGKMMPKAPKTSPGLSIELDDHYAARVYTTNSVVTGQVVVNVQRDTPFENINICFLGTISTSVRGLLSHTPIVSRRTILKLTMPISESSCPAPRIFRAGQQYNFSFHFVIPEELTVDACYHRADTSVHHSHTQLPPSMGGWENDHLSTQKARVQYTIQAEFAKTSGSGRMKKTVLKGGKEILVLPNLPDEPPLDILPTDKMYALKRSKHLKSSFMKAYGGITATAFQPPAVMLSNDGRTASSTQIQVNLDFKPASNPTTMPKITKISTRVKAMTIFGFHGFSDFPDLGDWAHIYESHSTWHARTTPISHQVLGESTWVNAAKQDPEENVSWGNQSSSGDTSELDGSIHSFGNGAEPSGYKLKTCISIDLPTHDQTFVPTYHSCIVSRVYFIQLSLALSAEGKSSNLTFRIPLQVGVQSNTSKEY